MLPPLPMVSNVNVNNDKLTDFMTISLPKIARYEIYTCTYYGATVYANWSI